MAARADEWRPAAPSRRKKKKSSSGPVVIFPIAFQAPGRLPLLPLQITCCRLPWPSIQAPVPGTGDENRCPSFFGRETEDFFGERSKEVRATEARAAGQELRGRRLTAPKKLEPVICPISLMC